MEGEMEQHTKTFLKTGKKVLKTGRKSVNTLARKSDELCWNVKKCEEMLKFHFCHKNFQKIEFWHGTCLIRWHLSKFLSFTF